MDLAGKPGYLDIFFAGLCSILIVYIYIYIHRRYIDRRFSQSYLIKGIGVENLRPLTTALSFCFPMYIQEGFSQMIIAWTEKMQF